MFSWLRLRSNSRSETSRAAPLSWRVRLLLITLLAIAILTVWVTNQRLTERFTETTRNRGEIRLALYSASILSELQRNSIVPQLLARDPTLISALSSKDYQQTTQRLLSFVDEIGAASLELLDIDGRIVASTVRQELGAIERDNPVFLNAIRGKDTAFTASEKETGAVDFSYSRRIDIPGETLGVIVVDVDLRKFERSWAGISDAVMVTDSTGNIVLATEPRWRGLTEEAALERRSAPTAIQRAVQATADWAGAPDAYLSGEAVMRLESRIPFQGWRIVSFTTYNSIRERVNGVLAAEIMVFAILLAGAFYLLSRKSASLAGMFKRESEDLRALNERLQNEIGERQRVQANLEIAEQSLAQSSKLAALGEMSAAVSHELNQPLAAMKTYLAGARLLLGRRRPEEALSSFQRIDDLIERMGAITRQLKSYARKAGDTLVPVDMNDAVLSALSIMEPQLKQSDTLITKALPEKPVMVLADRVRLEQVIINLLRNAFDATRGLENPSIDLLLTVGETAVLAVRDNGAGIDDLDALFEPFYTTKQPGDGVGLGLAISSGIVSDLGGRLTARNGSESGAVFEMQLPLHQDEGEPVAAE
ncbi:MAG: ATP-binding protein [Pseudomonadota bacterium]